MALQVKHLTMQLDAISNRQTQIIDGFLSSKEKIIEQTGQITAGMLETIQKQTLTLETSATNNITDAVKTLPNVERLSLEEKTE